MELGRVKRGKSHRKDRHHPYSGKARQQSEDTVPGVQKIKSSLRQAKRLLTKENLAANVRVETERKIKALEADLVKAQNARQERAMAVKYHKVKFFERQKVVRKIKQTKRSLQGTENTKELESTLFDLRVDLNYILHYPRTKKYVSLFPPEVRNSNVSSTPIKATDDDERSKIRELIRSKMRCGELSLEPDHDLEKPQWERRSGVQRKGVDVRDHGEGSSKQRQTEDASGDEFFGDDDDDISESSSCE